MTREKLEIEIADSSLRWAITEFIKNLNVLMSPTVEAIRKKSEWVEIWRDGKDIPDGYRFIGDNELRPAYIRASAIYNAEHQIGKITVEIVESNQAPYSPPFPLRKARITRDALFTDDPEMVIQAAHGHFVDHADFYCKRKNGEAQS